MTSSWFQERTSKIMFLYNLETCILVVKKENKFHMLIAEKLSDH